MYFFKVPTDINCYFKITILEIYFPIDNCITPTNIYTFTHVYILLGLHQRHKILQ